MDELYVHFRNFHIHIFTPKFECGGVKFDIYNRNLKNTKILKIFIFCTTARKMRCVESKFWFYAPVRKIHCLYCDLHCRIILVPK